MFVENLVVLLSSEKVRWRIMMTTSVPRKLWLSSKPMRPDSKKKQNDAKRS